MQPSIPLEQRQTEEAAGEGSALPISTDGLPDIKNALVALLKKHPESTADIQRILDMIAGISRKMNILLDPPAVKFAECFKDARAACVISQPKLAKVLRVRQQLLSAVECKSGTREHIEMLAEALGVAWETVTQENLIQAIQEKIDVN